MAEISSAYLISDAEMSLASYLFTFEDECFATTLDGSAHLLVPQYLCG